MTDLLIAFVIPILVIILATILESLIHCPFKVAGIIFIIAITIALILGGTITLLLLAWFFTFLAFIVAVIVNRFFGCGCSRRCHCNRRRRCRRNDFDEDDDDFDDTNRNTGRNNNENNNIGDNNTGDNNVGNNNTGSYYLGNNNIGNNNTGNNLNGNNGNNGNDSMGCRYWRG